jgi:putative transcriptional regulator
MTSAGIPKGVVSNRIRALRTSAAPNLTQQGLAAAVGATRQTIIAVEAGKYAPSLELAFRISRALGCPFEEVFTFDADDKR